MCTSQEVDMRSPDPEVEASKRATTHRVIAQWNEVTDNGEKLDFAPFRSPMQRLPYYIPS